MDFGSEPTHSGFTIDRFTYSKLYFIHILTIWLFTIAVDCRQFDNPTVVCGYCYWDEADSFTESGSSTPLSIAF